MLASACPNARWAVLVITQQNLQGPAFDWGGALVSDWSIRPVTR